MVWLSHMFLIDSIKLRVIQLVICDYLQNSFMHNANQQFSLQNN
jgi:hypothetical protein